MFLDAIHNLTALLAQLSIDETKAVKSFLDRAYVDRQPATVAIYDCTSRRENLYVFSDEGTLDPEVWFSYGAVTVSVCESEYRWFISGKPAEVIAQADKYMILGVFA